MTTLRIRRFASRAELDTALVQLLAEAISVASPAATAIMLSGGSTPLPAYRELARRAPEPGKQLHVLYSDDRYVPASSEASNYHQSRPLLEARALPAASVLRARTELALEQAAEDYERRPAELLDAGLRV